MWGTRRWEDYERNEAQLALNSQAYAPQRFSPPREGPALETSAHHLWQLWRTDDRALSPARGPAHRARLSLSAHKYLTGRAPLPTHSWFWRRTLAIGALLVERVTPETLAMTIAVQDEIVNRAAEAQRLRHLQVERAQYEADLAQRRSHAMRNELRRAEKMVCRAA
jgi:hypothetical protein